MSNNKMASVINWTKKHLKYHSDEDKKSKNIFSRTISKRYGKNTKQKNKTNVENSDLDDSSHEFIKSAPPVYDNQESKSYGIYDKDLSQDYGRYSPSKSFYSNSRSKDSSPIKEINSISYGSNRSSRSSNTSFVSTATFQIRPNSNRRSSNTQSNENNTSYYSSNSISSPKPSNRELSGSLYPQNLNPFGDDEEEEEETKNVQTNSPSSPKYPVDMNPFGSESDESDQEGVDQNESQLQDSNDNVISTTPFDIDKAPTPPPEKRKIGGSFGLLSKYNNK